MERRGQQVFLGTACVMCHAIGGTPARARLGPDLTHVGSRLRIASAMLPNVPQHLMRWINDPQAVRPGVIMPGNMIAADDLWALAAYLESLK